MAQPVGPVGETLRAPKTAELIAAHIRRQVVLGELREGDTLPPETTLMGQFGVSRPTLRGAFRILETESLISVRRGAREVRGCVCPLSDACTERRSYGMKRVLIRRRRSIACLFPEP